MSDTARADDFDQVLAQYHRALEEFFAGNPQPVKDLYSHRDDASLGNPFGPVVVGWENVERTIDRAAANYRDGENTTFELTAGYATPELRYVVEVERTTARIGGSDDKAQVALRVTSIFRREDRDWKVSHRHADPITSPRSAESVIVE